MIVGIIVHAARRQARELAKQANAWLAERGHTPRLLPDDAAAVGVPEAAVEPGKIAIGLELAMALGGDGTVLRTVDLVAGEGVPVLGVNVGHLGYLTEIEPMQLEWALDRFLAGTYSVEDRMLLQVAVDGRSGRRRRQDAPGDVVVDVPAAARLGPTPLCALNEAVLEKTPMGHTVRLVVSIDGELFTVYPADGLIVATPTGSTAYSLSAGGPIVAPEHRALILTPVSPHTLFDRPLVFGPEAQLRLEVAGNRPATLSVDGRNVGVLHEGDAIVCTSARRSARLVTFGPRHFHQILQRKFGLNDRQ